MRIEVRHAEGSRHQESRGSHRCHHRFFADPAHGARNMPTVEMGGVQSLGVSIKLRFSVDVLCVV